MSEAHARRIEAVRFEFEATEEALVAVIVRARLSPGKLTNAVADFERARRNLEKTYYVRVVAEMEGMLYRHLADYHPGLGTSAREAAGDLIARARNHLDPRLGNTLPNEVADEAMEVVRYRNWLAHGEKSGEPDDVRFTAAIERLKRLLLLLPRMRDEAEARRRPAR